MKLLSQKTALHSTTQNKERNYPICLSNVMWLSSIQWQTNGSFLNVRDPNVFSLYDAVWRQAGKNVPGPVQLQSSSVSPSWKPKGVRSWTMVLILHQCWKVGRLRIQGQGINWTSSLTATETSTRWTRSRPIPYVRMEYKSPSVLLDHTSLLCGLEVRGLRVKATFLGEIAWH